MHLLMGDMGRCGYGRKKGCLCARVGVSEDGGV